MDLQCCPENPLPWMDASPLSEPCLLECYYYYYYYYYYYCYYYYCYYSSVYCR